MLIGYACVATARQGEPPKTQRQALMVAVRVEPGHLLGCRVQTLPDTHGRSLHRDRNQSRASSGSPKLR